LVALSTKIQGIFTKRQNIAAYLLILKFHLNRLISLCFHSELEMRARQISIAYRQEKHGTALAIELFAKNFNSLGCRIFGIKSFAKGSTS
jgi:hypothetical protein